MEECVHLFQAELQNLLFEIPVDLCSDLQVLFKHLMKSGVKTHKEQEGRWSETITRSKCFHYKDQEANTALLVFPRSQLVTKGDQALQLKPPEFLPIERRQATSVLSFKSLIKPFFGLVLSFHPCNFIFSCF